MNKDSFFTALENQFKNELPFVVYSRPISAVIKCWLQKDDTLYITDTFKESGFVFAPFDSTQPSILLPSNQSEYFTLDIESSEQLPVNLYNNKSFVIDNSEKSHLALLRKGIAQIKTGELSKVVLSRNEKRKIGKTNPIELFKRLYNDYKNAMVYCWYHPKVGLWFGATPELLFKVVGDQLTTISLAGTKPYKEDNAVNWTAKEIEEQKIVTDYITQQINDFTSHINVFETETVRAGDLLHLKTRVISTIKKHSYLNDIIKALHPTPAVCGMPKEASKAFILENEDYNREFYTGFLGELNLRQEKVRNRNKRNVENNAFKSIKTISNFYVNLRCMQIKDDVAHIYVGGGITKDSVPEDEWEETVNKTKTIVNVLN